MVEQGAIELNRRQVLGVGTVSAAALTTVSVSPRPAFGASGPGNGQLAAGSDMDISLRVNGTIHNLRLDPRTSLLDALRERLSLTGSKKGCDQGQCGACTVLLDGRRILSCLTLAVSVQGEPVTTIEGLADADGELHPMQQAFIDHDGFQCGYCTPGQIMSAVGCVAEGHAETEGEIREYMSGNLCRCAAYPNIVEAIKAAKPQMRRV